ncbi:hypothetical protein C4K03_3412 [Pseudomonas synxantha]|uniref:Uncharacterized protein n=1 Tax=Pseudomonas synxantha TaxID=47883 RepID=A0A3G7U897_9PSED|nr:hypothetical protein C4K03_3412 [Pseudomonas synxantha]
MPLGNQPCEEPETFTNGLFFQRQDLWWKLRDLLNLKSFHNIPSSSPGFFQSSTASHYLFNTAC